MDVRQRNHVRETGSGRSTLIFAHGFGCDQNMWRFVAPHFADRYRVVLFDHVGSGQSDWASYRKEKYSSLHGYAEDLVEIAQEFSDGPVVLVGHSVSAMIGVLAHIKAPSLFTSHVMIGPSPCYINDGDYIGGFSREDIISLLETLESNYLGWSSTMAPAIMGAPGRPELSEELTNSFCRSDPEIAKQFASATFLSDYRNEVAQLTTPTLILQCTDDMIAPVTVGQYLHAVLPNSTLVLIDNVGHCPHLSAPDASVQAMEQFLSSLP
jgi:sigma-B regulation protein RsbQ